MFSPIIHVFIQKETDSIDNLLPIGFCRRNTAIQVIVLHRLAKILQEISSDEIQVLQALEKLVHRFEYIPLEEAATKLALDADDILFLLGKLNKIRLVRRKKEHYLGYRISRAGYDALALHDLAQKDVIVSLGQPYGVGKEASVYRALDTNGNEVAVKFLRWGQTSFKRIRRLRKLKDEPIHSWMAFSKRAAKREFGVLQILHNIGGKVPQPIALNRHVIVMSQMTGDLLLQVSELEHPQNVLEQILQQVQIAYQKAELVHGDLSEYNIFVDETEQITIFDWPQWQPLSHPNSMWLLKRDLSNILTFFKRRFSITYDVDEILKRVTVIKQGKKEND
ncbi:MAG: RIO1 family regulatory kinase/ATPase [Promethearchaeota archaeon]